MVTKIENTYPSILKIKKQIQDEFFGEATGHDWYHIERVYKNALKIHELEGGNPEIIAYAALLHDIADHKFVEDHESETDKRIREILGRENISQSIVDEVLHIAHNISYKGANVANKITSLEGKIVQDADRLDAIGAIGIARAFAYGGNKNRAIYLPTQKPTMHESFDAYKNDEGHTINHFYEKLLLLKDKMNTETGKKIAQERHDFMQNFLDQFYAEWEAN
ncbi:MAG: HD domain-containing protein [Crocinitomicaceae bacterium]|nr:HD domain-containing protein [Crocinitomicaceae bacterium]